MQYIFAVTYGTPSSFIRTQSWGIFVSKTNYPPTGPGPPIFLLFHFVFFLLKNCVGDFFRLDPVFSWRAASDLVDLKSAQTKSFEHSPWTLRQRILTRSMYRKDVQRGQAGHRAAVLPSLPLLQAGPAHTCSQVDTKVVPPTKKESRI